MKRLGVRLESRGARRGPRRICPRVEALEERALLAVSIDGGTLGYYNDNLGNVLDGTQPQFPTVFGNLNPAAEPNLAPAASILGNWLGPNPSFNANWSGLQTIEQQWTVGTETAIVYPFTVAPGTTEHLVGDFGVDNGIFVWVDGVFKFGVVEEGSAWANEYANIDLGTWSAGTHYLQILREDHGLTSDSYIQVAGSVTNLPPTVQFSTATYTVAENGGQATITVTRTGNSQGTVTVGYATSNGTAVAGSDYVTTTGTLTFGPGVTSQTFDVPITDDVLSEGDETVRLTLSNPTGGASLGSQALATLTITDVEAGRLQFDTDSYQVLETGRQATIQVSRVGGRHGVVSVTFTTRDGTATADADYASVSTIVTFADQETARTVVIPVAFDDLAEGNETVQLGLTNPTGGAGLGTPQIATLTIVDYRPPKAEPVFLRPVFKVRENGRRARITVLLANALTRPYSVAFETYTLRRGKGYARPRRDYDHLAGTLTFDPGQTSVDFFVRLRDDNITEGDEQIGLRLLDPVTREILAVARLVIVDARRPAVEGWWERMPCAFREQVGDSKYP